MSKPILELELPDIGTTADWFKDLEAIENAPPLPMTPPQQRSPTTPHTPQSFPRTRQMVPQEESDAYETLPSKPLAQVMDKILNTNTAPPEIPPKSPERHSTSSSPFLQQIARKTRIPSNFSESYKIHELMTGKRASPQPQVDNWIMCMMLVQFDHEIGPDFKVIQPSVNFSEQDLRTICFLSLPERSTNRETSGQFHTFRFDSSTFPGTELHGFALFSQQRLPSSQRGYIQESLVIISRHNFVQLFNACIQLMRDTINQSKLYAPVSRQPSPSENIEEAAVIIKEAITDVSNWPLPDPNSTLELPFLGAVINLSIPLYESMPLLGTVELDTSSVNFHSMGRNAIPNGQVHSSDSSTDDQLYKQQDALVLSAGEPAATWDFIINYIPDASDLYILYEYMLLAKPIVVLASTPNQCSTFISLLVDLIRPIPYAGKIREYLTIHTCPEEGLLPTSGITGVTNPLLLKNCIKDNKTLVFVLSPSPLQNRAISFKYWKTYENGVGVLKRKGIDATRPKRPKKSSSMPTSPKSKGNSSPRESWSSKFFNKNAGPKVPKIEKSKISNPLVATFVKMPNNLKPLNFEEPNFGLEEDHLDAHEGEEEKVRELTRKSHREILKHRLLFPDQKFLSSLSRLIHKNVSDLKTSRDKTIDFTIRFHFATVTSKFLGPLGCYLDPTTAVHRNPARQSEQLAFSHSEFINDLASNTTATPRPRDTTRLQNRHSMIMSSPSSSTFFGSSDRTASVNSDNDGTLYQINSSELPAEPHNNTLSSPRNSARLSPIYSKSYQSTSVLPLNIGNGGTSQRTVSSSSFTHEERVAELGGENRRASMLALSSIGLKFASATSSGNHDTPTPAATTTTAPLLSRAHSTSGVTRPSNKHVSSLFTPPVNTEASSANTTAPATTTTPPLQTPSSTTSAKHAEQANLQKQVIYRTFLDTPNFGSWLTMNNVNLVQTDKGV